MGRSALSCCSALPRPADNGRFPEGSANIALRACAFAGSPMDTCSSASVVRRAELREFFSHIRELRARGGSDPLAELLEGGAPSDESSTVAREVFVGFAKRHGFPGDAHSVYDALDVEGTLTVAGIRATLAAADQGGAIVKKGETSPSEKRSHRTPVRGGGGRQAPAPAAPSVRSDKAAGFTTPATDAGFDRSKSKQSLDNGNPSKSTPKIAEESTRSSLNDPVRLAAAAGKPSASPPGTPSKGQSRRKSKETPPRIDPSVNAPKASESPMNATGPASGTTPRKRGSKSKPAAAEAAAKAPQAATPAPEGDPPAAAGNGNAAIGDTGANDDAPGIEFTRVISPSEVLPDAVRKKASYEDAVGYPALQNGPTCVLRPLPYEWGAEDSTAQRSFIYKGKLLKVPLLPIAGASTESKTPTASKVGRGTGWQKVRSTVMGGAIQKLQKGAISSKSKSSGG